MREDPREIGADDTRPLPTPTPLSAPFWDAARDERLVIQRCNRCGAFRFYPRPRCPSCLSDETTWQQVRGTGRVYSYTIVERPLSRWFADRVPLVVAIIELDEGVRMMANVVDCRPEDVSIDMPVEVAWEHVDEMITLPTFVARTSPT